MKKNYNLAISLKFCNLFLFTIMSVLMVTLGSKLHVIQISFLRVFFGCFIAFLYLLIIKQNISFSLSPKVLAAYILRAVLNFVALVLWVKALHLLGLNEASAISYMVPIWTTLLATIFCGEKLNLKCAGAILVSLIGMFIILKPNIYEFKVEGLIIAFASTLMWAGYDITCKKQTTTEHYMLQTFYTFMWSSIISFPFALYYWQPVEMIDIFDASIISVIGVTNVTVLFLSYKFAPITVLMPFSYCRLIFMGIASYLIYNIYPGSHLIIGACVIALASFYIFIEQKKGKLQVEVKS
ncbi:Uncharacterized protein NF27_CG01540 [Candidatus Jidaibacter acanthamoeba]|uniref:S-adenosylmethionine uptake transporter n=1 Tax=Candidatus Jidaibacter acanthamoebae TaxID=86105 RepID=A0A0C1QKF2_9RICK|nr:DMT family transporter [Candidatus Jidaibacter acanthamoeba]KIE05974.1 Uncharacterized protein NF27_CG01540 [Candidatus Jidaibacter acanthamoeba]